MKRIDNDQKPEKGNKVILGIILLFIGALLLLDNLNLFDFPVRILSWQVIMIIIGTIMIVQRRNPSGFIIVLIGLFFLTLHVFHISNFTRELFWPAILIMIGLLIIFRNKKEGSFLSDRISQGILSSEYIDDTAIFGGGDKKILSDNFKGGRITNIFGGSNISLMDAKLAEGVHAIDVLCVFGGSKFLIPADWNIKIETINLFGGFSDKRRFMTEPQTNQNKLLVFKGFILFGGVEIKNI